jgi:cell division protein FtsI (penicillin-binding protein 3)
MRVTMIIASLLISQVLVLNAGAVDLASAGTALSNSRPTITDRNGVTLATDIGLPSLYATPGMVLDADAAAQKLHSVLPELDPKSLRHKLAGAGGFIVLRRNLPALVAEEIRALNIQGLTLVDESQRFYPFGEEAAFVTGWVNIDQQGMSGIELHLDDDGLATLQTSGKAKPETIKPVSLSIDLRVQNAMYDQLADALTRYQAIAASGVMMNIKTGEIIAMVSLPSFDPNRPGTIDELHNGEQNQRFNRITSGIYELGSTFKTATLAAALDAGAIKLTDTVDATDPIKFGRVTIDDYQGKHRVLTVPEVFKFSSNIGTIKIMQAMGKDQFRAFLTKMAFDEPAPLELREMRPPNVPKTLSEIGAATASFGHGLEVSPLHMVRAYAALVNDGMMVEPTLFPRSEEDAAKSAKQVVSAETSARVRYLLRLNALEGSGTRANMFADGYRIGGKTGTAEKVVGNTYDADRTLAIFASAFPMEAPLYAMVILIDEPKPEDDQSGVTGGWNAGEVTGRLVTVVAPMLGIEPYSGDEIDSSLLPSELM